MARTAFASVRAMSDSASDAAIPQTISSPARPRFAETLTEPGPT